MSSEFSCENIYKIKIYLVKVENLRKRNWSFQASRY